MTSKHTILVNLLRDELNGVASSILEPDEANRITTILWANSGEDFIACRKAIFSLGGIKPSNKVGTFRGYSLEFLEKLASKNQIIRSEQETEIYSKSQQTKDITKQGEIMSKLLKNPPFFKDAKLVAALIFLVVSLVVAISLANYSETETFVCKNLHGSESIISLKFNPIGKPNINITKIPDGKKVEATLKGGGDGWISWVDLYGNWTERDFKGCKVEFRNSCGRNTKVFYHKKLIETSQSSYFQVKVFSDRKCCGWGYGEYDENIDKGDLIRIEKCEKTLKE